MKALKIKGIKIKFHFSTLVIVALVGYYVASLYYTITNGKVEIWELFLIGLLNGVLILFSIILHELMHSLMAKRYGLIVLEIELYLFGGVSKIEDEPDNPRAEFFIAVVGPLTSIVLGILFLILYFLPIDYPPIIYLTFFYIGLSNIILGIFNSIPAFPMDGGRVLRAYLWKRRNNILSATRTATKVGVFFGYAMIIFGVFQSLIIGIFGGFWLILMGWFLITSAKRSYNATIVDVRLSNLSINYFVHPISLTIPFDKTILEAYEKYFMPYKKSYFPVSKDNQIVGITHIKLIKEIPLSMRMNTIIGQVTNSISTFDTIYEDENCKKGLIALRNKDYAIKVLVVLQRETDTILGFISEEEINAALVYSDIFRHT